MGHHRRRPRPTDNTVAQASGRNDGGFHIWFQNPDLDRIDAGDGIDVLTWGHRYSILAAVTASGNRQPLFLGPKL